MRIAVRARLRNTNRHPLMGSACGRCRHAPASPSMPARKSTGSTATRMRMCGVIWIITRSRTPGTAPAGRPGRCRAVAAASSRRARWPVRPRIAARLPAPASTPPARPAVPRNAALPYCPQHCRRPGRSPLEHRIVQAQLTRDAVRAVLRRRADRRVPQPRRNALACRAGGTPLIELPLQRRQRPRRCRARRLACASLHRPSPCAVAMAAEVSGSAPSRHACSPEGHGQAAVSSAVLHADETGMRVAKKLHWLHVLATDTLTWMGCHPKRGTEAFDALALLQQFQGVLVHDGWIPYKALLCQHALCNAHHLRELTYLLEEQGQAWAGDMIEVLTYANHLDNVHCADGQSPNYEAQKYQSQVRDLRDLYDAILAQAQVDNPIAPSTGKRGRPKQSKATNLIGRLRDYSDDVWRFMTQANVPFTNNLAEQTVRMPKVKQKVSGCFRTLQGAQTYCVIRSYCATLHKQGANVFESLVSTFKGTPPQPGFG